MSENYISTIAKEKIYPIIRCKDAEETIEIAQALVNGGIKVLEINSPQHEQNPRQKRR